MARKSRKNLQTAEAIVLPEISESLDKKMATAAYARLSVEKEQDESIQTQIVMLHNYIAEHPDMKLTDTYIDNGYTGTNFERPNFVRMMDDVRTGKIQCIVVKDLSRFGRDFLETGYYIETLLPRLNVRLIAINDNFDSFRECDINNIAIPIKNMVNDLYAKDFSRKVTAYNDLHRARGDVKLLRSVYGYKRDTENNIYVVNPDTAPIVQMIFRWFLMGVTSGKIADRLNRMQILTPLAYKTIVEKGESFTQEDAWNSGRVRDIIRNIIYIGDLIWGKRRKILYLNVPTHKTPKEEWIVWHHMHEPLVSKADFAEAQKILDSRAYRWHQREGNVYPYNPKDPMQGMVFCMDCGKRMSYTKYCYGNRDGASYSCDCRVTDKNNSEYGRLWKVHSDFLKIVVADQVNIMVKRICDRKRLVSGMQREIRKNGGIPKLQRKKQRIQLKLEKVEEKLVNLYESLAEEIVNAEDYQTIKTKYMAERDAAREELQKMEVECRFAERQLEQFMELEIRLEQYLGETGLNETLLQELVASVHISQNKGVEVRFKYENVIGQIDAWREEEAAE